MARTDAHGLAATPRARIAIDCIGKGGTMTSHRTAIAVFSWPLLLSLTLLGTACGENGPETETQQVLREELGVPFPGRSRVAWQQVVKQGFPTSCLNDRPTVCPMGDAPQTIDVTIADQGGLPLAG